MNKILIRDVLHAEGNQNGQSNLGIQQSQIGRRLQGSSQPKPKPKPVNSANAIQSNGVTGAASGGSQPVGDNSAIITSIGSGNAENGGAVFSGNRKRSFPSR